MGQEIAQSKKVNYLFLLINKLLASHVQYCAKVMQTIIDEYRDNRDLSAIFER